jgi:hypothetical protein
VEINVGLLKNNQDLIQIFAFDFVILKVDSLFFEQNFSSLKINSSCKMSNVIPNFGVEFGYS